MLGKYIVKSFHQHAPNQREGLTDLNSTLFSEACIVSYARSTCKGCDVNIKGDVRDTRLLLRVFSFYTPETVITAIKPPLLHMHYRRYIEINLFSMVHIIDAAKGFRVKNFIYISSIAAAGHYFEHDNTKETDEIMMLDRSGDSKQVGRSQGLQRSSISGSHGSKRSRPFYTDFEAPYDASKRFSEDYLLNQQDDEIGFNVIAIRIGGVLGGTNDPYILHRWPILVDFDPPTPEISSNYAGNTADAVMIVYKRLAALYADPKQKKKCEFCGSFYYLTGERLTEHDKAKIISETTNKFLIVVPRRWLEMALDFLHYMRFDPHSYWLLDFGRMGLVKQTFDDSLFRQIFPEYEPKVTIKQALRLLYGSKEKQDAGESAKVKEDL